jgi:hypothetical protein
VVCSGCGAAALLLLVVIDSKMHVQHTLSGPLHGHSSWSAHKQPPPETLTLGRTLQRFLLTMGACLCPACCLGARCAEAFLGAGHYDRAASLLARVGQISRALDLLQTHDLPLSEELAEALTPPKEAPGGAQERQAVLLRLAQVGEGGRAEREPMHANDHPRNVLQHGHRNTAAQRAVGKWGDASLRECQGR